MSNADKTTGSGQNWSSEDSERWCAHVKLLVQRFPNLEVSSVQALEKNWTFRELCDEYDACLGAVGRLSSPGADEGMRREYVALQLRLEGELLRYLAEGAGGVRR